MTHSPHATRQDAGHTLGAWVRGDLGYTEAGLPTNKRKYVFAQDGKTLIAVTDTEPDAVFIVKACNSYDTNQALIVELVKALQDVVAALAQIDDYGAASGGLHPDIQNLALDHARAAITKAKAGG